MEQNHKKDILYLHLGVMLFSFSGIIAQYVEVPSILAAMGRVLCSSTLLFVIAKIKKESLKLDNTKDYIYTSRKNESSKMPYINLKSDVDINYFQFSHRTERGIG